MSRRAPMVPKSTAKLNLEVEPDEKLLLNAPEVSLFMAALAVVNHFRGLDRAFKGGEISKRFFMARANAALAQLTKTVAATERFDIVLPVMGCGQFSPFFWRWFNWWEDYFKKLTPRQVAEIKRLGRERELNLEDYRPGGHWLSYRHTPVVTLVKA